LLVVLSAGGYLTTACCVEPWLKALPFAHVQTPVPVFSVTQACIYATDSEGLFFNGRARLDALPATFVPRHLCFKGCLLALFGVSHIFSPVNGLSQSTCDVFRCSRAFVRGLSVSGVLYTGTVMTTISISDVWLYRLDQAKSDVLCLFRRPCSCRIRVQ
jgi:hypothetical protein